MSNHNRAFTKFHKLRKNFLNYRGVHHHSIIYAGQLLNPERNWNFRVYKGGKSVCNFSVFHADCADFYDFTGQRRKSRCLYIKDNKGVGKLLSLSVCNHTF